MQALLPCNLHSLHSYLRSKLLKIKEDIVDLIDMLAFNWLLTFWTIHEGKLNPKCRPLMFKKFNDTICVEYVSTFKFNAWFLSQFTGVAYLA